MESLIKLTVKTPNQGYDDVQVECQLEWTVKRLKDHLEEVYPTKPCSGSQKLIYLGRLLQDHLSLKEVFGEWGARTLHIVCNDTQEISTPSVTSQTPVTSSSVQDVPATTSFCADGLRQRATPTVSAAPVNASSMYMYPQYTAAMQSQMAAAQYQGVHSELAQQHQLRMHQYYQQLYHWQQAMGNQAWASAAGGYPWNLSANIAVTPPNSPYSQIPQPSFAFQTPPPQVQADSQERPVQPPAQAPGQPQPEPEIQNNPVNLNAGPGGGGGIQQADNENENPRNRDWLDWLYTSLRAFMLLSIVYFYSSTSRFVMVTLLAFLLYLYQNGWFTPRRVPVHHPVQEQHEQQQHMDDLNGEDQEEDNDHQPSSDQENSDNNREQEEIIRNEPEAPSFFRTLCIFCVSFVTSLVPNPPEVG